MTIRKRAVAVKELPQILNEKERRLFLREIQNSMNLDRPRLVLDCSNLRQMDRSVLLLLLDCLEEAMKRNGDVKLAALPPGAVAILEMTGVNRLFDVYETATAAASSFYQLPAGAVVQPPINVGSQQKPGSAA